MKQVVLVKLTSGEELIGELHFNSIYKDIDIEQNWMTSSCITVSNMFKLIISTNQETGYPELGLFRYPFFASEESESFIINLSAIAYIRKPLPEMLNYYLETFRLGRANDIENIQKTLKLATENMQAKYKLKKENEAKKKDKEEIKKKHEGLH